MCLYDQDDNSERKRPGNKKSRIYRESVAGPKNDPTTRTRTARKLGGKNSAAPTGTKRLSQLCDELLSQFAQEFSDESIGVPPIDFYFSTLLKCKLCGAMKDPKEGIQHTYQDGSTRFHCQSCVGPADEVLRRDERHAKPQKRLF